jgi:hypothetical protein
MLDPDVLNLLAPGTHRMMIGRILMDDGAASVVLKNCANLAMNGWAIYVARIQDGQSTPEIEYGVFRALKHAFAQSAEESMRDLDDATPVVLIRNRGYLMIELVSINNRSFTASFTSSDITGSPFTDHVHELALAICEGLPTLISDHFFPYIKCLLVDLLQHCHGTLIGVHTPCDNSGCPETMVDGVWLHRPIDLANAHAVAVDAKDAESLADLQSLESILRGMINNDGVVLFDTKGRVIGYRIFLKPNEEEKKAASHKGGGRRRTYELMKSRLGESLRGVFFRSQDGATDCQRIRE